MICRAWHSYGAFDNVSVINLENAHKAGIKYTDVYMFPCVGMNATLQMETLINSLKDNNAEYGYIWMDIESNPDSSCNWSQFDQQQSCDFIMELGNAGESMGRTVGVYASQGGWKTNIGKGRNVSACSEASKFPLWYDVRDHMASFDDWDDNKFGGWTKPNMKQYWGNLDYCHVSIDLDYY